MLKNKETRECCLNTCNRGLLGQVYLIASNAYLMADNMLPGGSGVASLIIGRDNVLTNICFHKP